MNEMNETNELNDIILNKGNSATSNKKIILAVATLGVILIVVVMLMNSFSSKDTANLPQAVLPPEPQTQVQQKDQEPLFEDVQVVEEKPSKDADLDAIAQKLKAESFKEQKKETLSKSEPVMEPKRVVKQKHIQKKRVQKSTVAKEKKTVSKAIKGSYYIQVGSFSKYEPDKKFLAKITGLGFHYKYHKVGSMNKVLVGPFNSRSDAKTAQRELRSKVEPGAFLVKL